MKNPISQSIKESLAEAVDVRFQATNTSTKSALFRFFESGSNGYDSSRNIDTILKRRLDHPSGSDTFMNALVNKLRLYPAVAQIVVEQMDCIVGIKIENRVEKVDDNVIDLLLLMMEVSETGSDDR